QAVPGLSKLPDHNRAAIRAQFSARNVAGAWPDSGVTVINAPEFKIPSGCPLPVPFTTASSVMNATSRPAAIGNHAFTAGESLSNSFVTYTTPPSNLAI